MISQVNLFNILFEKVPMGVAIFDTHLTLQRCNRTWQRYVEGYSLSSTRHVEDGVNFYALFPGAEGKIAHLFQRVLNGETIQQDGFCLESQGVTFYWDLSLTPITEEEGVAGFVLNMTDATDRELAHQLLRERENEYMSIFEFTTDGLLIYDLEGNIAEANPAACQLYGYSYDEFILLNARDLSHPDRQHLLPEAIDGIRYGRKFLTQGIDVRKDGSILHTESRGVPFVYRGQPHALVVVRDVTEQVRAYQLLEQRVKERTRELTTLLEISNQVTSTLELHPLLNEVLDQLKNMVDYDGSSIFLLRTPEELELLIYRGPIPQVELNVRWPLLDYPVNQEVIARREALMIPDTSADTFLAKELSRKAGDHIRFIKCWMGVPLIVRDQVIGMITFDHEQVNYYTVRHAHLAQAFANQVAIAIENARLYEQLRDYAGQVEERTRELATLLEISHSFASTLELKPLFNMVLDQVKMVADYTAAAVVMLQGDQLEIVEARSAGSQLPPPPRYRLERRKIIVMENLINYRQPVIIADVHDQDDPLAVNLKTVRSHIPNTAIPYIHCWMGIPLVVREEVIGIVSLDHKEPGYYNARHARLAMAFANQVAVAIENARLYEQARELATIHERQRLARELHDAVTQTLFSASLIAEVLPFLWKEDPDEGERRLEDLQRLTRGALAEMRSLLLELRPAGLIETPLGDLLRYLMEATTGRTRLPVHLKVENPQRILPADVQIVFYRIAQEALNNIIKHARAAQVNIHLQYLPQMVELSIVDNGRGFDMHHAPPDHLGLRIMQERAETIDAQLLIASQPDRGTQITVTWQQKDSPAHE